MDIPYVRLSKYTSSHKYLQISITLNFKNFEINQFKKYISMQVVLNAFYSIGKSFNCDVYLYLLFFILVLTYTDLYVN